MMIVQQQRYTADDVAAMARQIDAEMRSEVLRLLTELGSLPIDANGALGTSWVSIPRWQADELVAAGDAKYSPSRQRILPAD